MQIPVSLYAIAIPEYSSDALFTSMLKYSILSWGIRCKCGQQHVHKLMSDQMMYHHHKVNNKAMSAH
jgi:hypothetical protein